VNETGLARMQLNDKFVVRQRYKRYSVKHNKKTEVAGLRWAAYHSSVYHGALISTKQGWKSITSLQDTQPDNKVHGPLVVRTFSQRIVPSPFGVSTKENNPP